MTRQRKWQLIKKEQGLCIICGKFPIVGNTDRCCYHLLKNRQQVRKIHHNKIHTGGGVGRKPLYAICEYNKECPEIDCFAKV